MNFNDKVNRFLKNCNNPQVYTGVEINVIKKPFIEKTENGLNICLIFPDTYEIGMSHYGLKLLYHLLNELDGINAERCFLPDRESMDLMKTLDLQLFSLENKRPVSEFDIVSFSLLSEMNFTNVLASLELAGIDLYAKNRVETDPIIMAGGISAINPEPLRAFIDLFGFGDGEALFPSLISNIKEGIENKKSRPEIIDLLSDIQSVYVPAKYPTSSAGPFFRPDLPIQHIKKAVFKNLENHSRASDVIVPITNVVFNRLDMEIARGCPQNCRFCQAKSYYAPYRYRSVSENLRQIKAGSESTGFESVSLSTLSTGDYPELETLLNHIPDCLPPATDLSVSSLRPASISDDLLGTIAKFRKTGITIVPEAGSERLRRVINKDVSDTEIFESLDMAIKHGWQKLKLYFMIGLPTETESDIQAAIDLLTKIVEHCKSRKKRLMITASFSAFVPKPHTPFQWSGRESIESLYSKVKMIKRGLSRFKFLDLDFHNIERGQIETILARGDEKVGDLLYKVYKRGEIFSAWDSEFHYSVWKDELDHITVSRYLEEIDTSTPLPWDFLEINFLSEYLKAEYKKSKSETVTPSCDNNNCFVCKGCRLGFPKRSKTVGDHSREVTKASIQPSRERDLSYNKVRVFYQKTGQFVYFSHLSITKYLERIIRKSAIPYKSTEGFRPHIKIAYLPPLPVYATGAEEVLEIFVSDSMNEPEILERLKVVAGELNITAVSFSNESKSLNKDIEYVRYKIKMAAEEEQKNVIMSHLRENDRIEFREGEIELQIDYRSQGPEQFSKIYKLLDPDKKNTESIQRTKVKFRSIPNQSEGN